MRWIVIVLVVFNLGYLGYQFSQPKEIVQEQKIDVAMVSGAASIKLLSESKVKNKVQSGRALKDKLCWAVGPYAVELDAKHLYARMVAMDIDAKVELSPVVFKTEFWVHLPPLPNKKQALRKLKELQKRKVDSFVITEGDLANGISLGLFSQKESVERLLAALAKKNIQPKVKELERTRNQYWVTAPLNPSQPVDQNTRQRLIEEGDMQWHQIRCNSGLPQA